MEMTREIKMMDKDKAWDKLVEYMWENEEAHWIEEGRPNDHIFMSLRTLNRFLNGEVEDDSDTDDEDEDDSDTDDKNKEVEELICANACSKNCFEVNRYFECKHPCCIKTVHMCPWCIECGCSKRLDFEMMD